MLVEGGIGGLDLFHENPSRFLQHTIDAAADVQLQGRHGQTVLVDTRRLSIIHTKTDRYLAPILFRSLVLHELMAACSFHRTRR